MGRANVGRLAGQGVFIRKGSVELITLKGRPTTSGPPILPSKATLDFNKWAELFLNYKNLNLNFLRDKLNFFGGGLS